MIIEKRYQVFVSSTFEDLKVDRQAAVEAILKAGHIPAGMELFTAGSESQWEVIKQWIADSDIYMLILGGRYGSIDPQSGLSYTELEFRYARSLNKPFFAVVMSDTCRQQRVRDFGESVIERSNLASYEAFKKDVTSQLCAFFDSAKDVKLAVFETLPRLINRPGLVGWIPASRGGNPKIAEELTQALEENRRLTERLQQIEARGGLDFSKLRAALEKWQVTIPKKLLQGTPAEGEEGKQVSLLRMTLSFAAQLARGVKNSMDEGEYGSFIFYDIACPLASWGLMEHGKVPSGVAWQQLKLSKIGIDFLNYVRLNPPTGDARAQKVAQAVSEKPVIKTKLKGAKSKGSPSSTREN